MCVFVLTFLTILVVVFFKKKKNCGILVWVIQWGGKIQGLMFKSMALPYSRETKGHDTIIFQSKFDFPEATSERSH